MSYTRTTNFGAKDSLPSGDTNKIVKGAEFDVEFNNIQTAINTLNSTVSGLGATISSISASTATVQASQYSSYYTAPNPGFVVLWFHGSPSIAAAANGAQTRALNVHVFVDDHGSQTNIPDTLHILSVGLG